jgi:hypothetical protein
MKTMAQTLVLSLSLLAGSALPQPACPPIVTVDGAAGIDAAVTGMVRWDLDGQGPEPPAIVVTGAFNTADGVFAPNGAYNDGSIWQPLTNAAIPRVTGPLFVHQGQLQTLSSRLNGTTWEPLQLPFPVNSGSLSFPVSLGDEVAFVRIVNGELDPITVRTVNYATAQTQVLGTFTGTGSNPFTSLAVFAGELYASGNFTTINGQPATSRVVRYDAATQSWLPVGAISQNVQALGIIDGSLIAGGRFTTASGERLLLRLVNGTWEPFGPTATGTSSADFIKTIDSRSWFAATDPANINRRNLFEVDSTGTVLGTHVVNGSIRELALAPEGLFVAGSFSQVTVPGQTVQLASMQNIARIDNDGVPRHVARNPQTLGVEQSGSFRFNQVNNFATYQGAPVAVGRFVGPINANRGHVAIMDANGAWQPLGDNILGSGNISPEVSAAVEFQGSLIIGGGFRLFNGTTTVNGRLARWNGQTQAWDVLANVNATQPFPVNAFFVRNNQLVVGGSMANINGVSTGNVATWDGTTRASIGANMPGTVWRLASYQGDLYAGATSSSLGVARWSGTAWQPLGAGLQGNRDVYDMNVHNGKLYVTGTFTSAGNVAATARIAAWNGSAWSALSSVGRPSDSSSSFYQFEAFGNDLAIGFNSGASLAAGFLYNEIDGWRPLPGFKQGATALSELAFIDDSLFLGGLTEVPGQFGLANTHLQRLQYPCPICDSIDFNNDGSTFDPTDVDAFLSVFSEGPCIPAPATCNDVDFNNDGSTFDPDDIDSFLSVFSEGPYL